VNGIENFWGFAKTKLRRYYGIDRRHFHLFLKEMEFRFNDRHEDWVKKIKSLFMVTHD
jgi:transposase